MVIVRRWECGKRVSVFQGLWKAMFAFHRSVISTGYFERSSPHFSQRVHNTTGCTAETAGREQLAIPPAGSPSLTQCSGREVLRSFAKLLTGRQLSCQEGLLRMPL